MDWQLESYFPDFNGTEYQAFKRLLRDALDGLKERVEALDRIEPASFAAWQAVVEGFEDISRRLGHISSYLGCLSACDSANEAYRREEAALALLESEMKKLEVALVASFGEARHDHFEAFVRRDALAGADFALRRWRERSRRLMSRQEEDLTAELEVDGLKAWSRLYESLSGNLEFTLRHPDGREEVVPMSRRRSLLAHPDRRVREAVFTGGNEAWQSVETVCASALNAIAGSRLTLCHRRNQGNFLDPALFEHRLGAASLEALHAALLERAGVAQGLLRGKARRLGLGAAAWYDLEAPAAGGAAAEEAAVGWEEAVARVRDSLGSAYPAFGDFVQEMVDKRWIEFTPRRGKRPGGFCTGSRLTNESRIFMTYGGTTSDIVTLAHEAGHAWHARVLREARPLARDYPMTLAESASTFAEMLYIDGLLADPSIVPAAKLQVLDTQLRQACAFLLDVPMRFEFEKRFHEERAEGEVPVSRLKRLMVEAQRTFFGDSLEEGMEDPFFWASKLHFYIAEVSFYNFPYTVGFLLSRALFARFKQEGPAFLATYEAFLLRSGSATCEEVARDILGIDLETPAFWSATIEEVGDLGRQIEALAPA